MCRCAQMPPSVRFYAFLTPLISEPRQQNGTSAHHTFKVQSVSFWVCAQAGILYRMNFGWGQNFESEHENDVVAR